MTVTYTRYMIDYEFIYEFSKKALNLHEHIRWVGIANKFGVLLNTEQRNELKPLLTEEENEDYAALTITRHRTRVKYEPKIGKLVYAAGRYQKLNRATIPINENFFLLIALDVELKNFDEVIIERLIPLIKKEQNGFGEKNDGATT